VAREASDLVLLDDNLAANLALVLIVVAGALGSFLLGLRDTSGGLLLIPLWLNGLLAAGKHQNTSLYSYATHHPNS
jgi:hypothetical protein